MSKAVESRVWIDDVLLQEEFGVTVLLPSNEPALPKTRDLTVTIPGRHGAYDYGAFFMPREFTLNIMFPKQSYSDLKYQIRKFVRLFIDEYGRPKTVKLRFGDEVDKYYNVRITDSIPVERAAERGYLSITLTAYDPYAYALKNANEVTWGDEVVTFEWHYPLGMDGTGAEGIEVTSPRTITVYVHGETVRPIIEIHGSASGLTVSSNGKTFRLPDFANTDWVIDGDRFVVLRDGDEELSALDGDFIELLNGNNDVEIKGNSLNFKVTIKHRDKYM